MILDIFAQNVGASQEGKAQVQLAMYRYRLPRLLVVRVRRCHNRRVVLVLAAAPARPNLRSIVAGSCDRFTGSRQNCARSREAS